MHAFVSPTMEQPEQLHYLLVVLEVVYGLRLAASGRHLMFQPEEKSLRCMLDFLDMFSSPGVLMVAFLVDTMEVTNGFIRFSDPWCFVIKNNVESCA